MSKVVTEDTLFTILRSYEERIKRLETALFMGQRGPTTASTPEITPETDSTPEKD